MRRKKNKFHSSLLVGYTDVQTFCKSDCLPQQVSRTTVVDGHPRNREPKVNFNLEITFTFCSSSSGNVRQSSCPVRLYSLRVGCLGHRESEMRFQKQQFHFCFLFRVWTGQPPVGTHPVVSNRKGICNFKVQVRCGALSIVGPNGVDCRCQPSVTNNSVTDQCVCSNNLATTLQ